ncbi:T9SS type A sorting domain-containing protein [Flavobacterium enshiense]|uniref:T9SS type A sorting domain-containing protein n=1 Tax=Flavobacterium enshiense TaxID=1341165 RepID=UPI00345D553C
MISKIPLNFRGLGQSYWFLTFLTFMIVSPLWAQTTLHSDSFNGSTPTYPNPYLSPNAFTSSGITAQGLSVGAGATGVSGTANLYAVRNWGQTTLANAQTTNDYLQFTLTPAEDRMLDINQISFQITRQNAQSPNNFTLVITRPSVAGSVVLGTQAVTGTGTTTVSFANLMTNDYMNNIYETITVRLYAYGTTGTNSAIRISSYNVNGVNENRPSLAPTTIWASQCGGTLATLETPIYSISVLGADRVRFKVARQDNPSVEEVVEKPMTNSTYFRLTELQTIPLDFNKGYLVTVQIHKTVNAIPVWSPYGQTCTVSTPNMPTTQVVSALCNATLSSLDTPIYSASVQGASIIRFKITIPNSAFGEEVIEKVAANGSSFFRLTELQTIPLQFGTTYAVSIQHQKSYFGTDYWSDYGAVCNVSTPNMPTSQVVPAQCNTALSSNSVSIYNTSVYGATAIRFKVWKTAEPEIEEVIEKTAGGSTYFKLTELQTLTVDPGVSYSVSIQYQKNYFGNLFWSGYGTVCTVTTPGTARFTDGDLEVRMENTDEVKAYPNPFVSEFQLTLGANSPAKVTVFDQSGRQIEVLNSMGNTLKIGSAYQSGIYLVVVHQGDTTHQVKMIKR